MVVAAGSHLVTRATVEFIQSTNVVARHQDTIHLKGCICIQAKLLDEALSRRVLEVLQPEQFQIALRAVNELQERSQAIDRQWQMRIERLDYQAHLAQRRYEEVDPSHRLVAATLDLTVEKRRTERKAILHIRWQGGAIEDLMVDLPLPMPVRIRYPESIVSQVRTLACTMTDLQIAATLNQAQLRSAKGKPFTKDMIKWIRYRYEIPAPVLKRPEEFTVKELAAHFQIGIDVVHYWIQRGQIPTRRLTKTAPYWLTISPQKELELRAWVTSSSRIKMQSIPKDR